MSNRRKPRTVHRRQVFLGDPSALTDVISSWRCPDCASEHAGLHADEHGIQHLIIQHDSGCPFLAGVTR